MGGAHHCAVDEPEEELNAPWDDGVLEWVRSNAARFVYTDERGPRYLLWRLVDNAVDEAVAGYATAVQVRLLEDGGVAVSDNGRGIPAVESDRFLPTTFRVAAALPEGDDTSHGRFGRFNRFGGFGGTRAADVWIVNALSTRMEVESTHAGERWSQSYERAVSVRFGWDGATAATGTTVRFWPDPAIFGTTGFAFGTVAGRLQELAFFNSGLTIKVVDERPAAQPGSRSFCHTSGLTGYVEWVNRKWPPIHEGVIHFSGQSSAAEAEVAMQWTDGYFTNVRTFVNNIETSTGPGAHEEGFRDALVNVISNYAKDRGLMRATEPELFASDICEGLTAVVSVKIAEPVFENRVGARLVDPGVKMAVQRLCENHLTRWLQAHPAAAEAVTRKAIHSADYARMPRRSRCGRPSA